MIRHGPPFNGKQFIGNTNTDQVHDLLKEDEEKNGYQIDEIKNEHIKTFDPDTLEEAHEQKFVNCDKCLGD